MPLSCSVPKCRNKRGGHMFPREKLRRQQWLQAARMEWYSPSKHSRICRKHFRDEDYELPKDSVLSDPRPVLKKNAIPSIFTWTDKVMSVPSNGSLNNKSADLLARRSHQVTNYHFKNKPLDGSQILNNNEIKLIPIKFLEPECIPIPYKSSISAEHTTDSSIAPTKSIEKQKTEIPLTNKSNGDCSLDNMDLVICDKALKYLTNKFQTTISAPPPPSQPVKPPMGIPPLIPLIAPYFVKEDNNTTKSKEKTRETEDMDFNRNIESKTVPVQCNLCQCSQNIELNKTIETSKRRKFTIDNLIDITNASEVQFFTGFKDYEQFQCIFNLFGDDVHHLQHQFNENTVQTPLQPCEEFMLTMIKLRRNKMFTELGFNFHISKELASVIFITWINYLFDKFKNISNWMARNDIKKYVKYGNGKSSIVIVECEGIQLKLKDPVSNKYTMLNPNKSIKVLVKMTELGDSEYVSNAIPGPISDKELICQCNIEKTVSESNLLNSESRIANGTKKVEKVIGLSKLFTILNGKMDSILVPLTNRIVYVCFMLNCVKSSKDR